MYTRRRIRLFVYVRIPSRQWYSTASFTGGTSLTSCLNISSANQSNSASLRHRILLIVTTRLHKITKVSIFKHSVTLSYLSPFPKCLHCWKAYEICCKYPPHFRHVAALSWEIKNSNVRLLRRRYRKVKDCFFLRNSVYILIYADHSTVVHVFSSLPQTRNVQKHIMQHIIVHCVKTKCKIGLNKHNRCTNYSTSTISGP